MRLCLASRLLLRRHPAKAQRTFGADQGALRRLSNDPSARAFERLSPYTALAVSVISMQYRESSICKQDARVCKNVSSRFINDARPHNCLPCRAPKDVFCGAVSNRRAHSARPRKAIKNELVCLDSS